jgi:hypothetical protein
MLYSTMYFSISVLDMLGGVSVAFFFLDHNGGWVGVPKKCVQEKEEKTAGGWVGVRCFS